MFLKNKNIIFKIRRVTDYAALINVHYAMITIDVVVVVAAAAAAAAASTAAAVVCVQLRFRPASLISDIGIRLLENYYTSMIMLLIFLFVYSITVVRVHS